MKTVLSGIRSTGHLHLGNYFGALRNFVQLQHKAKCYFFIADLHSLTTHPKPVDFHSGVKTILSEYLASGLDPEKSTLFVQSSVPQAVSYTHLRAHETVLDLVCRLLLEKKNKTRPNTITHTFH